MKNFRRWFLVWLFLLLVIGCLLGPFLANPFYADDYYHLAFVKFTPGLKQIILRQSFARQFWRPLVMASDFACLKLFGTRPAAWHILDLLLHSANALLVALIFHRLLQGGNEKRRTRLSILAGTLFAVHPVAILTTAWVACRADLLAGGFSLLALLLLSALETQKPRPGLMVLSMLAALPAFACKESSFVIPALAWLLTFGFPAGRSFRRRLADSSLAFLLTAVALALFLAIRLKVMPGLGGYEPIQFRLDWLWPRLTYHLPRVLGKSLRDFLLWHLPTDSLCARLLLCSYLGLAIICLRAFCRAPRFWLAGLAWVFISILPYWNLSHMFAYGEARWLYLGSVAMPLALLGSISTLERPRNRGLAMLLLAVIAVCFLKTSRDGLRQFQERSNHYEQVKQQIKKVIPKDGPVRVYVYGLDFDFYYLDAMLKVYNPKWLDRIIVPAQLPSIAWVSHDALEQYQESSPIYPKVEVAFDDGKTAVAAVTPPQDLIEALARDQKASALEWKRNQFRDISSELGQLYNERNFLQISWANPYQMTYLPSFSFRKRIYPLEWKLSPKTQLRTPEQLGELYTFLSNTNDPYLISPPLNFPAIPTGELSFKMKVMPKKYLAPQQQEGCFAWMTDKDHDWQPRQQFCFTVTADGKFHTYRLHLDHNLYWLRSSIITKVRLDPISFPAWFQLDEFDFHPIHERE